MFKDPVSKGRSLERREEYALNTQEIPREHVNSHLFKDPVSKGRSLERREEYVVNTQEIPREHVNSHACKDPVSKVVPSRNAKNTQYIHRRRTCEFSFFQGSSK